MATSMDIWSTFTEDFMVSFFKMTELLPKEAVPSEELMVLSCASMLGFQLVQKAISDPEWGKSWVKAIITEFPDQKNTVFVDSFFPKYEEVFSSS